MTKIGRSYSTLESYASALFEKRNAFFQALEQEELQRGEHGKSQVVHSRYIHDPGIQQEPLPALIGFQGRGI